MSESIREAAHFGGYPVVPNEDAIRILVVDDDPEMRRLLAEFLRGEGFRVDLAANGQEALRQLCEEIFDHVVLDKNLPGESGLEMLPLLRALAPGTPVTLITAFGDSRTHEQAFTRGAYEVLLKPFNLDDLVEVLRKAQQYVKEDRPRA
jgi:DNA-binding NtrC family response regulator